MPEPIELHNDGPHSPEYTAKVADFMAECARTLNYCTRPGSDGLEYPGDAYALLANLHLGTGRLPQLLDQIARFLDAQLAPGVTIADDQNPDVAAVIGAALVHLEYATRSANDLTARLREAQNAISGLHAKDCPGA